MGQIRDMSILLALFDEGSNPSPRNARLLAMLGGFGRNYTHYHNVYGSTIRPNHRFSSVFKGFSSI